MSLAENKRLVTRAIEEIFGAGDTSLIKESYLETFRSHTSLPIDRRDGWEGVKNSVSMLHEAFTNYRPTIEEIYAETDRVTVRLRIRGIQSGQLGPIAPTGRSVDVQEISIFRIEDGRIAEVRSVLELFQLFQQLEVSAPELSA